MLFYTTLFRSFLLHSVPSHSILYHCILFSSLLVKNINAQHKVLKRSIITETLTKTEINFTDVSSLVLRHLQSEEYIQVFRIYANYCHHTEEPVLYYFIQYFTSNTSLRRLPVSLSWPMQPKNYLFVSLVYLPVMFPSTFATFMFVFLITYLSI